MRRKQNITNGIQKRRETKEDEKSQCILGFEFCLRAKEERNRERDKKQNLNTSHVTLSFTRVFKILINVHTSVRAHILFEVIFRWCNWWFCLNSRLLVSRHLWFVYICVYDDGLKECYTCTNDRIKELRTMVCVSNTLTNILFLEIEFKTE